MIDKKYLMETYIPSIDGIRDILNCTICDKIKQIPYETIYSVESNKRNLDHIAFDTFGDEKYWWVIGVYNDIITPVVSDYISSVKIPDKVELERLLTEFGGD